MSEKMIPLSYEELLAQIDGEYKAHGTIFGVSHLWHAPVKSLPIFGGRIESPLGPAAGPHTQLAQNIIAAYAAGARFFELKTVQIMDGDELAACVSRPCILAQDEGYNCEWSTELTVPQAMDEYIKAWRILKIISEKYGLGSADGFVFNMSVGYTMEGIGSEKITAYLDSMRDAGVSDSVTISTLHGCPPEEIELIANYLIGERGLNTYAKCNPTLLGYDFCRKTLDSLGYGYIAFDDRHFREDLQWKDAVSMFRRLQALAKHMGVEFGVKLTNTFPVDVTAGELPSEEMYMSGRALYPLTTELASRLSKEFGGALRISYSGGADWHSVEGLYKAGIWPITMATNLLRPGGYNRLAQLSQTVSRQPYDDFRGTNPKAAAALAKNALSDPWYKKPVKPILSRKIEYKVPLTDCFFAPCREGCPIHQDIPAYVRLTGQGKYDEALALITERNPLPNITGTICAHPCMTKCTRQFYEGPVDIRGCKLEATEQAYDKLLASIQPPVSNGKRVAIVGAGPAGIASAYFLARAGCAVTVFEKAEAAGGVVGRVIPSFRIAPEAVERDVALAKKYGAEFRFGQAITDISQLAGYDDILLCTGAWVPGVLKLEQGQARNAIAFLSEFKEHPHQTRLGRHVVVVGGGNTAMDTARTAKKVWGVKTVTLVYRRDAANMPADEEELQTALADGVTLKPLLSPVSWADGALRCQVMTLGARDASGRRSVEPTGEEIALKADAVIAAVGERTDSELYKALGLETDSRGRAVIDPKTGRSSIPNIYLAGDGATGPSTVVQAIAGAARAARAICPMAFDKYENTNAALPAAEALAKKGVFLPREPKAARCLECAAVCENCVDVCPNRANVPIEVDGRIQILHLDGPCNHCGNCTTFCPWDSAPYREKWTLYWTEESFAESDGQGFVPLGGAVIRARFAGTEATIDLGEENGILPPSLAVFTRTVMYRYPWLLKNT
ncbi:MAG: putative selenate reductase subunit YgfK [Oscillospiraceae bacterium]|nr:putative selenate reductase subunit YgfK [Oscillospiraceae bacterium]